MFFFFTFLSSFSSFREGRRRHVVVLVKVLVVHTQREREKERRVVNKPAQKCDEFLTFIRENTYNTTQRTMANDATLTLYQSIEPEVKEISLLAKGSSSPLGGFFGGGALNAQPEIRECGETVFSQIRAVARHTSEREWFEENEVLT